MEDIDQPSFWQVDQGGHIFVANIEESLYVRTGEIGATLPDPTVLLKALGTPVTLVSRTDDNGSSVEL